MMSKKSPFFVLITCLFLSGCGQCPVGNVDQDTVVMINDYSISRGEFENEFKASTYGEVDTPESRQNFLNTLIDRKLILQYAQREGLDKEPNFLKAIERFWEQSLLKVALDKKTKEIESKITASDWQVKRAEEAKAMSDWMSELRKKARITLKDSAPGNPAGQEGSR
ncbi:MAG: SurA N-terminal domain-containing protein [Candidatus Omnitrophota bacterium]